MKIYIKHYGRHKNGASKTITLTVKTYESEVTAEITNLYSYVDQDFINDLMSIVEDLQEQNNKLTEQTDLFD